MKGRTYALLALTLLAALGGAWAIQRTQNSFDFRLVFSLKRLPEAVVNAAFGSRKEVADPQEDWQMGGPGDAKNPLPQMRFLLGKAYADGHYELEFERGGETLSRVKAELWPKDGGWEKQEKPVPHQENVEP